MPKRSREHTEETIKNIKSAVEKQLVTHGYNAMSYTTLSQFTGVSRTGISHHFPRKIDLVLSIEQRMFERLISKLDVDKDMTAFSSSWIIALKDPQFVSVLKMIFCLGIDNEEGKRITNNLTVKLIKLLQQRFGEKSKREIERLLGYSFMVISLREQ